MGDIRSAIGTRVGDLGGGSPLAVNAAPAPVPTFTSSEKSACEGYLLIQPEDYTIPAGNYLDFVVGWETNASGSAADPWFPLSDYEDVSCYDTYRLVDNSESTEEVSCEKEEQVIPQNQLSGTFTDGTTYTVGGATNASMSADNNFTVGDAGVASDFTLTFSAPVCIRMAPSSVGSGAIWHATPAQGVTTVTTDGTPWVFTPGPADPGITVNGQVADGSAAASSITSTDDWGTLESDNVTQFTFASWVFDSFDIIVSIVPQCAIPLETCNSFLLPIDGVGCGMGHIRPVVGVSDNGDGTASVEKVNATLLLLTNETCPQPRGLPLLPGDLTNG